MKKILAIFIMLFVITGCDKTIDKKDSSAFFIKNNNNKYELYNLSGKKIETLEFDSYEKFYNGYSIVKKDDKYAIINDNGELTVKFGEYSTISRYNNLYMVDKDNKKYLITGNGDVIENLDSLVFEVYKDSDKIYLLTSNKTKKIEIKNNLNKTVLTLPLTNNAIYGLFSDKFALLYNNTDNYLIDLENGSLLADIKTERQFCFDSISDDKKSILLKTCKNNFSGSNVEYRLVNNNVFNQNKECGKMYIKNNIVLCDDNEGTFIITNNKKTLKIDKKMAYNDNLYYVKNDEKTGVDFYKSDKLVKHIECRKLVTTGKMNDLFILSTQSTNGCNLELGYELYNQNGEKLSDIDTYKLSNKDLNNNYIADNNGKYFLINNVGKKISDEYDKIELIDSYYIVTNNYIRGILDSRGNEVLNLAYDTIEIFDFNNKKYALLSIIDDKDIIYNISDKKQIYFSNNKITREEKYFYITYYNNKYYYSYINGKVFYKEEIK